MNGMPVKRQDTVLGVDQQRCFNAVQCGKRLGSLQHEGEIQVFLPSAEVDGSLVPGARNMEEDIALPQQAPHHHQPTAPLKLKCPGTCDRMSFK